MGPVANVTSAAPLTDGARVHGRAVADDKGPIAAFLTALELLDARKIRPAVNLKVFFEGEEESASPELASIRRRMFARRSSPKTTSGAAQSSPRTQIFISE